MRLLHRARRAGLLAAALVVVAPALAARTAGGQVPGPATSSITGTVTDSVHDKPGEGAMVLLTRVSPAPSEFRSAIADEKGRFRFDSLVAGRYSVVFATAFFDSLSINFPAREVVLGAGQTARADFATPSGATLRAVACPGIQLTRGHGAVIGQVTDADTERPLAGAHVAVSWVDLSVDSAFHPVSTPRGGEVVVDSLGRYRLCGVPTDTYLMVQVQDSGRAGSVLTMSVGDAGGVLVRELSLSMASAQSIAALDSAAAAAARDSIPVTSRLLGGTATVTGTVYGPGGQPLAEAQLRVRGAAGEARSDSAGRFALSGQPAGSQLLEARRVGYLLGQVPVELRSGRSVEASMTLRRIVNLDSILVVARRSRYPGFESRRKNAFGHFLDESEIEKRHAFETSDLFRMMPGFRVRGVGFDAKIISSRGFNFDGRACETNVVINGIQHQDVNLIDPSNVGAVEAYAGRAGAPPQYDAECGLVMIWMKR